MLTVTLTWQGEKERAKGSFLEQPVDLLVARELLQSGLDEMFGSLGLIIQTAPLGAQGTRLSWKEAFLNKPSSDKGSTETDNSRPDLCLTLCGHLFVYYLLYTATENIHSKRQRFEECSLCKCLSLFFF